MESVFFLILLIFGGLFSIFCSVMNYNWFIENKKAWIFVKLFGRTGARIFYIILGIAIIVLGLVAFFSGQM